MYIIYKSLNAALEIVFLEQIEKVLSLLNRLWLWFSLVWTFLGDKKTFWRNEKDQTVSFMANERAQQVPKISERQTNDKLIFLCIGENFDESSRIRFENSVKRMPI